MCRHTPSCSSSCTRLLASDTVNENFCCASRRQEMSAALIRASPLHRQLLRGGLALGRSVHRPRGEARLYGSLSSMNDSVQESSPDERPSDRRAALSESVKVPDYNVIMAGCKPVTAPNTTIRLKSTGTSNFPFLLCCKQRRDGLAEVILSGLVDRPAICPMIVRHHAFACVINVPAYIVTLEDITRA